MGAPRYVGFDKASIAFLEQLGANNNREWFKANKARYDEQVLDVALRFIQSMQDPLAEFAPQFTAIPQRVGGSLMRVYRDTRFSKNKLPYKTNIGIQFRHEQAKDVSTLRWNCGFRQSSTSRSLTAMKLVRLISSISS